ncbi:pre-B-cell leukemia homeobox interacting protein 1b isoform X2 [Notolabrus celidotus]|uniref:pre-B-cell leukemia homeobox interacting protein 1b isoform X2 n=1 Tax=Notolabrus celidotus TaxID=1203425 RepID=UPI00149003D2|nr:pre-B-cell leukemia homeobox interacting protein 1b isoform X2 [Notolabrus celidotus]
MSGGSSTNNSWTILTPEEAAAETLKPLGEETEHHEDSLTSGAGSLGNQPANFEESAEGPPVEGHQVPEEETAELSGDTDAEQHTPVLISATDATDATGPTSLEASGNLVPDSDALSQSEGLPEGPAQSGPDPDSFSDSYTHITPSPEEPPTSLLSTETLGGGEFTEEEESITQEGTVYPLNGEGLQHEGEESELFSRTPDIGKQADSRVDSVVAEEQPEKTEEEGEPEVRRRRSLLAALDRIGKREEEEEGEEEFQLPPRDDDSGFSVNKCILGAVILLGLGTIFLSGVFMDLDEDSDYATRELKDAEVPGKQDWLNPEVPPAPVDADSTELLNKLSEGSQQISELQAQLQAQKDELKVAKGAAAEGVKERLRWEEVEKENTTEASTPPPSGQPEDSTQGMDASTERQHKEAWDGQREKKKDMKKDEKYKKEKEKFALKEGGEKEYKEGEKTEWKKGKHEKKGHSEETKQWKEKDLKKDKAKRGDEGKSWKDREGKNEWKDTSGRKEWKEEKDWKKGKHEKVNDGKQRRGKEEKKDWKVGRDQGEKYKRKEWKEDKEWKKGKDSLKESGKEKWEKRGLKEKAEKKEWKKESDWKSKESKTWKERGERKQWEDRNHGKERKEKDERKQWNENDRKSKNGKDDKAWKKKEERKQWEKKEEKWKREKQESKDRKKHDSDHGHEEEHLWGDQKPPHSHHKKPTLDQPEYWVQQRDRLQHIPTPPQHCNTPESCAQAEGLLPVTFPEFEVILQTYLTKAKDVGVDDSKREELKKLASEFFKDEVFVHDQMSFQDFVEDVGDILEDMVEGDGDGDGEEEDSAIEEEMEGFEKEVMKKFSAPEKEEQSKEEWRKESGRVRG